MFIDLASVESDAAFEADLCIVGAGMAGISLAQSLINSKLQVVLVESGGFELEAATQELYSGESIGLPYFDLATTRLRFFGGSSNHWEGQNGVLESSDFVAKP
jgi:choline dehydrogenase-like flavoprotein